MKCCICGCEIVDDIIDGNNPDPLKDENGKFLADDPVNNRCCKSCDHIYVTPYRICQLYNVPDQCSKIQNKVWKLRKGWMKNDNR